MPELGQLPSLRFEGANEAGGEAGPVQMKEGLAVDLDQLKRYGSEKSILRGAPDLFGKLHRLKD
jgi:hypothetical protein